MAELKPCPFCGGEAELSSPRFIPHAWVACKKCGVSTPTHTAFTPREAKEQAVNAWNRRESNELD